jgi:hypothetical protein
MLNIDVPIALDNRYVLRSTVDIVFNYGSGFDSLTGLIFSCFR